MQQINLYQSGKKKQKFTLSFDRIVSYFQMYILVLVLIGAYEGFVHFSNKKQMKALSKLHQERTKTLESVSKKLPKESTRQQILAEIDKYEKQIKGKKIVYSMISEAQNTQIHGYASYLEALARLKVDGLWLTEFMFRNNGQHLLLEGRTIEPGLVPQLISTLKDSTDFFGKTFEVFKMSFDEETRQIDFILQTKID